MDGDAVIFKSMITGCLVSFGAVSNTAGRAIAPVVGVHHDEYKKDLLLLEPSPCSLSSVSMSLFHCQRVLSIWSLFLGQKPC